MIDEIIWMSAAELLSAYGNGRLSPVEATAALLRHIDARDPEINAFCLVDADRAFAAARTSERRWTRGEPCGLLDGVMVSIKDNMATRGWPTLRGSRSIDSRQDWPEDATVVARLRQHGAVLVGKTTTPELSWKAVTDSPLTGVTRNPWDPTRTAGGSSGGAAAAVAAGMGPIAIGSDGGGSIRIPAAFCGIYGVKPTFGRVPHSPPSPYGMLSHIGPLTRTVEDAARTLDVISGPDGRDGSALSPPPTPYTAAMHGAHSLEGWRVAISPALGFAEPDPEVTNRIRDTGTVLSDLGATVESVDPALDNPDELIETFEVLFYAGAAMAARALPARGRQAMDPGLKEIADRGERFTATDYLGALHAAAALDQRMIRFHDRYDLLVTATVPIPAFAAGHEVPPGWPQRRWTSWSPLTYPFNLTGQPAASLPSGHIGGLPVGAQLIAARGADDRVLIASRALQAARPWRHDRPPPSSKNSTAQGRT
jgi:aspartyl-tRNA(Asn)/glutamyl-tRNA(Gln) amidotransferase subunit A